MSLTLPWTNKLLHAVNAGATTLVLQDAVADLCACLDEPSHAFATIYTVSGTEKVLVTACEAGELIVTRGVDGTEAKAWPACACFKVDEVVEGEVCPDPDTSEGSAADLASMLTLGKGLEFDTSDPNNPVLQLVNTGVAAGDYGGATVNACGQFTFIPEGWPSNTLADFDLCCPTDEASVEVTAADVTYSPEVTNKAAVGPNVEAALNQIDAYLCALDTPATGVVVVTTGKGLTNTGNTSNPVLELETTGFAAGTYAGFTIDECGRVVGYTPAPSDAPSVVGDAPIDVSFDAGTNTYTVSIAKATKEECGAVMLADEAGIATPLSIGGSDVITWDFLRLWAAAQPDNIAQVASSNDCISVAFDGADTFTLTLNSSLVLGDDPIEVNPDPATGKFLVSVLMAAVGQKGVVQLADSTNAPNPALNNPDDVVTSGYLEAWKIANGL